MGWLWHDRPMLRWLGIIVALALVSASADAQVFKPKSKKAAATQKAAPEKKKTAKKQPRTAPTKKRVAKKKKAKAVADDAETESESTGGDKDFVKIWDDEEIE